MTVQMALKYAEEGLGVHKIYQETLELQSFMDSQYQTRAGLESESRKLATELERRKMAIVTERLQLLAEESIAAHERGVKVALANDEEYQRLVDRSNEVMAHRDGLGAAISSYENNHKGHVARMKLLGGFFEFCAAIKQDETIEIMAKHENPF
jgi:hypothetical protein